MGRPKRDSKTADEWIANYGRPAFDTACAAGHVGKQGADKDFKNWCAAKGSPYDTRNAPPPPPASTSSSSPLAAPPAAPPSAAPSHSGASTVPAAAPSTSYDVPSSTGADLSRGEVSGLGEGGGFLESDFLEGGSSSPTSAPVEGGGSGLLLVGLAVGGWLLLRRKKGRRR